MAPIKKKLGLWAVVVLALGGLAVLLAVRAAPKGIEYHGRSLLAWCLQLSPASDWGAQQEARSAIREIGPRAVPELTRLLQARDSWAKLQSFRFSGVFPYKSRKYLYERIKAPDASSLRGAAARALGVLGPQANQAVRELSQALHDKSPQVRLDAAMALGSIGEAATGSLVLSLEDGDRFVRKSAVFALGLIGPPAAQAIPALSKLLNDRDEEMRSAAAHALQNIAGATASSAPGTTAYGTRPGLKSDAGAAEEAIHVNLGAPAKGAGPQL